MSDELDRELTEVRRLAAQEVAGSIPADTSMVEKVRRLQLDLAARDAEVAAVRGAERMAIIAVINRGYFLSDTAPIAQWARELTAAIERDAEKRDALAQTTEPT